MNKEIEKFLNELDEKLNIFVECLDGLVLNHKRIKLEIRVKDNGKYGVTLHTNILGEWGGFSTWVDSIEEIKEVVKQDLIYRFRLLERE